MFKFYKSIPVFFALSAYASHADAVLEAVIVSGARTEQSTLTTPASITVITRDEIETSGARNIVDLLHGRGGIQISDSFGDGSRSSIGMRGFGETANANTLILVDSRRLNNPDIASPDLNSIALEDVERVEIVQGSAGVLFGDQAVGGVINVITRKPGELRSSLKLSAGSYNTVDFHTMASQALDSGINYRVSLNLRDSDNYRDHNEASYLNGFVKLGYDYDDGLVFAELEHIDDELNTPGTLFADEMAADRRQVNTNFSGDFSDAKTTIGRLGLKQELNSDWSFEGEVTSRDTEGVFRLSSVFGAETENSTQDRNIKEFTPRFIGRIPELMDIVLSFGADLINSDYKLSSRFGDQLNEQSQESFYAQAVVPVIDELDVTIGVRHASIENSLRDTGAFALYPAGKQIDDDVTVGTLGIAIKANDNWRILVRADQNYRFAKVDEFLAPAYTPTFTPVILETQEGLSLETGVEWHDGEHSAKVIVYKLDLDNEIAFDPANYANINLDETERRGLIAEGRWQLSNKLGFTVSYTLTDAEVVNGAFAGKEIPLVAKHSGLISADYQLNSQWQLYGELQALSDRSFSGDFNNVLSRLPGYGVVNVKAEYTSGNFVLSGRVNNLMDKEYTEVGVLGTDPNTFLSREAYLPSPEKNVWLSASWKFK
ncbi:MAG: TonB-dependent receptor [Gammaproteobacteria bacterium]|nr:TonB-dependent receptor [Gammaproteobacteria bacterium]